MRAGHVVSGRQKGIRSRTGLNSLVRWRGDPYPQTKSSSSSFSLARSAGADYEAGIPLRTFGQQVPAIPARHLPPITDTAVPVLGIEEASRPSSPEEMDGAADARVAGPSGLPPGAAMPDRTPLDSPYPDRPAFLTVPSSSAGLRRVRTSTDRLLPAADGPDDYDPFEYFTPPPVPKFGFWRVEGDVSTLFSAPIVDVTELGDLLSSDCRQERKEGPVSRASAG